MGKTGYILTKDMLKLLLFSFAKNKEINTNKKLKQQNYIYHNNISKQKVSSELECNLCFVSKNKIKMQLLSGVSE